MEHLSEGPALHSWVSPVLFHLMLIGATVGWINRKSPRMAFYTSCMLVVGALMGHFWLLVDNPSVSSLATIIFAESGKEVDNLANYCYGHLFAFIPPVSLGYIFYYLKTEKNLVAKGFWTKVILALISFAICQIAGLSQCLVVYGFITKPYIPLYMILYRIGFMIAISIMFYSGLIDDGIQFLQARTKGNKKEMPTLDAKQNVDVQAKVVSGKPRLNILNAFLTISSTILIMNFLVINADYYNMKQSNYSVLDIPNRMIFNFIVISFVSLIFHAMIFAPITKLRLKLLEIIF